MGVLCGVGAQAPGRRPRRPGTSRRRRSRAGGCRARRCEELQHVRQTSSHRNRSIEAQDRPFTFSSNSRQLLVGVDGVRIADRLEHRHVGLTNRSRRRLGQVVALGSAIASIAYALLPCIGVESISPVYRPSSMHHLGRDDVVGAEHCADGLDHLAARLADDDDVVPTRRCSSIRPTASSYTMGSTAGAASRHTMSLTVCTCHPAACDCEVLAHPLHLVVVGPADEVDELGVGAAEDAPSVDQAAGVERRG